MAPRYNNKEYVMQKRKSGLWKEAKAKELCDGGVTEARHQLTLLLILVDNVIHSIIASLQENLIELLGSTHQMLILNFDLHGCGVTGLIPIVQGCNSRLAVEL